MKRTKKRLQFDHRTVQPLVPTPLDDEALRRAAGGGNEITGSRQQHCNTDTCY